MRASFPVGPPHCGPWEGLPTCRGEKSPLPPPQPSQAAPAVGDVEQPVLGPTGVAVCAASSEDLQGAASPGPPLRLRCQAHDLEEPGEASLCP